MSDLGNEDIVVQKQLPFDQNQLEQMKDCFLNQLTVEQLSELVQDIEEELQLRKMKEVRLARFKKEIQKKKLIMKKQLKEEEEEERLKMKKKLRKETEEEDDDVHIPKTKRRN
jgi:hypothetical protein